jgi:PAS domain S-box-containing protein
MFKRARERVITTTAWLVVVVLNAHSLWARMAYPQRDPEYLIEIWESEEGMPDPSATSMVQSGDGQIWVGTFNGLARFDGVKFTVLDAANTSELPSSGVVNLHLDAQGGLWVSTLKGLVRLAGGHWQNFTGKAGWTGDYARSFAERSGVMVVTSFDGKVFRYVDGQLSRLPEPPGERGRGYFGYVDATGTIWLVQHRFFGWWDGSNWHKDNSLDALLGEGICAGPAVDGGLWIVRAGQLCKFDGKKVVERRLLKATIQEPWSLAEDREGEVWVPSYEKGLYRIKSTGEVIRYSTQNGLSYNGLRFFFQDREGNRWVGSGGGGLMRLKQRTFLSFGEESGLPQRIVKSVAEEPTGDILAGTYGRGVARLSHGAFAAIWCADTNGPDYTQSLLVDRHQRTWVGRLGLGLTLYDTNGSPSLSSSLPSGRNVSALFEDQSGKIWVGGSDSIVVFADLEKIEPAPRRQFRVAGVTCFEEQPSRNCVWAGTDDGLFRVVGDQVAEQHDSSGQSLREVTALYANPHGSLWIGTARGLFRLRGERMERIPTADAPRFPKVTSMVPDDWGYLWLGSRLGVGRVRLAELEGYAPGSVRAPLLQIYTRSDGLPAVECSGWSQPAAIRDHLGRLWFATLGGVSMVDPRKVPFNQQPPPVLIEQVRVEDFSKKQRYLWSSSAEPVVVPPGLGEIAVFFSALSYTAPEKVRFAYRIDGFNQPWVDIGNRHTVYFYPPPPGRYRLHVKAANNDGVWNEEGASLSFVVLPFYWQTLWFRALIVLGCAAGTGGTVWRVLNDKIRAQRNLLEERGRSEAQLRESEARFRQLAAAAWEGIAVTDGTRMVDANDQLAAMLGGSPASLVGRALNDFVAPDSQERVAAAIRADEEGPYEHLARRLDGTIFPVEVRARKVKLGDRTLRISSIRDVTVRRQAEQALRHLAQRLMRVQDLEQRRIGRELHDSTGQALAALEITLAAINKKADQMPPALQAHLAECTALASQCTAQIRTASYLLHPPLLEELGLASALHWLADGFSQRSGIAVTLDLPRELPRLGEEYELTLFRVVQESLTNVHRHSGSPAARVRLRLEPNRLELEVADDGQGIPSEKLLDLETGRRTLGVGISGMRERLRQLGGELRIVSSSAGTQVLVILARTVTGKSNAVDARMHPDPV